MKIERTKNAARNVLFGGLLRVYSMLVPFLMRTVILYQLGVNYLGLDSLFASILQVLNLAELGIGGVMVFSMYKPIAEDDTATICALMNLYKKVYRIIGLIILTLGLAITPFLPSLVHSGVPEGISLYALYFMNLAATVLSYWLFAYKNSLLYATQRSDVGHKVHLVLDTLQYGTAILLIFVFHNYYMYLATKIVFQVVCNITISRIVTRMYPDYEAGGDVSDAEKKAIVRRVKDLFTAQLGGVVMNSSDAIMISAFLGIRDLAIYQNYFFIISSLRATLEIVLSACTAGIGNSLVLETKEKNYHDFRKLTFLFCWLSGLCCAMLLCLYQPFMELWVGKDLLLTMPVVVSFVIYLYVYEINRVTNIYKDAAGIWHEDRFRPLVASIVNIALNALTITHFRFFGVIFSTVISVLFVQFPWLMHNLFRLIFPREFCLPYVKKHVLYAIVTAGVCAATYGVCALMPSMGLFPTLAVRFVISFILPNALFLLLYFKTNEFNMALEVAQRITKGKIPFLKRLKKG